MQMLDRYFYACCAGNRRVANLRSACTERCASYAWRIVRRSIGLPGAL